MTYKVCPQCGGDKFRLVQAEYRFGEKGPSYQGDLNRMVCQNPACRTIVDDNPRIIKR